MKKYRLVEESELRRLKKYRLVEESELRRLIEGN